LTTPKPFEQTIVADGKTLWLYDQDLNQVTSRSQAQALGPLAERLRPRTLSEVIGQQHLLGPGMPLRWRSSRASRTAASCGGRRAWARPPSRG
jgi:hypothetical protein